MKLNWGHGIFIAIALFMGMIIAYVVAMMTAASADHRLVEQDYFKKDLVYQQIIDAEDNLKKLGDTIAVIETDSTIHFALPTAHAKGTITLQRMETVDMDRSIQFELNNLTIETTSLKRGIWLYNIRWADLEKEYFYKSKFVLK